MDIIKKIFIFFLLIWCIPALSFAAGIFFNTESNSFSVGEDFLVEVFVDTENEGINAVEGKLVYTSDFIEIKEIRDGNSHINFWIERPYVYQPGTIIFSGIIPGGFSGGKLLLFSMLFHLSKSGQGSIQSEGIQILKNDGQGSKASAKSSPFNFSISAESKNKVSNTYLINDTEMPESFKPAVANDPEIFAGEYFLVFITQDKGAGIDHYEVREGFWGKYVIAESPYLLKNQSLDKKIYVKAIDKAQNERIVVFKPDQWRWYQQYALLSIMLVLIIAFGFAFKKTWLRFIK